MSDQISSWLSRLNHSARGATMVEYAFLVMLIGLVVVAGALFLGQNLNDFFLRARDCLSVGPPC